MQQSEWFGNGKGYNITFRLFNTSVINTVTIEDITSNSCVLDSLQKFTQYDVTMNAFNDVGSSSPSPPAYERTRESGNFIYNLFIIHLLLIYKYK